MSGFKGRLKQHRAERRVRRLDRQVEDAANGVQSVRSYKDEMLAEMFRYGGPGGGGIL